MSTIYTPRGAAWAAAGLAGEMAPGLPPFPEDLARRMIEHGAGEEKLSVAWEMARLAPGLDPDDAQALVLVFFTLLANLEQGSTRIPLDGAPFDDHVRPLMLSCGCVPSEVDEAIRMMGLLGNGDRRLSRVVGRSNERVPMLIHDGHLYMQRLLSLEQRLVASILPRLQADMPVASQAKIEAALADLVMHPTRAGDEEVTLSSDQLQAVRLVARRPLAVISGGPGTGKTSIVVSILRLVARLGKILPGSIALAAPTGRAADRLRQSIDRALAGIPGRSGPDEALASAGLRPTTLHRLLGYSPRTDLFSHHASNRLEQRLVIVDECSMIDVSLMEALLSALGRDARLVLLGDAEQLPSVEAGAVLRDLMDGASASGAAHRLVHSWRMDPLDPAGRRILGVAGRINAGAIDGLISDSPTLPEDAIVRRAGPGDLRFEGVELVGATGRSDVDALLRAWDRWTLEALPGRAMLAAHTYLLDGPGLIAQDEARLEELFEHTGRFRILTLTRSAGATTSEQAVNAWFHERASRAGVRRASEPHPGEPVIVLKNDYDRGLFNGDQGIVLSVRSLDGTTGPCAVFRGERGWRTFPLAQLAGIIQLSHAITVHRAQGSEHDHVLFFLPRQDMRLVTREIVYTAITRARSSVTIAGDPEILALAATRPMRRSSGIADALRRA